MKATTYKNVGIVVTFILFILALYAITLVTSDDHLDSDDDGYPDDIDDFPNDYTLYKRCCVDSANTFILDPGEIYESPLCSCFNVNCSCEYVQICWHVEDRVESGRYLTKEEKQQIYLYIHNPEIGIRYNALEFSSPPYSGDCLIQINREGKRGNWTVYFENPSTNPGIFMEYGIYKMK